MKFCPLVLELHLPQIFVEHRQTDRHFPDEVQIVFRTCKSIKNRKSKIFTKPILSSIYVEENKKYNRILILNKDEDF